MYLDTYYPHYKYIDSENAKLFSCLYYEARRSSEQVFTTFLGILVRVYINNVMLIYDELDGYTGITENQLNFFQQKGIWSVYGLMIAFSSCVNIEIFENIYKDFRPGKDYDSHCFKVGLSSFKKFLPN